MGLIGAAVAVVGLLFLSRLIYKPPKGSVDGLGEDQPPAVSTRGVWVPLHFGTTKTEQVIIAWAGSREVKKESVGGGGGGKGGGGSAKQDVYYEETMHVLGIGPARSLHQIRMGGKIIWEGPIFADDVPSGTEIEVGNEGTFRIYWGEADQPINTSLGTADKLGYASRHPRICYIHWIRLRYGTSPTQPQMEYVLGWNCAGSTLEQSDYFLDNGFSSGVNGAHIIHALTNGGKFIGAGMPLSEIDNDTLELLGMLMEQEHLPMNFTIYDGPEVARPLQGLLQDMGVQMPTSQGRLVFFAQRYEPDADIPVFGDDSILPPDIELEKDLYPAPVTRPIFTYKDETGFNFREQDIPLNDSGQEEEIGLSTSDRVLMPSFTNASVASQAARRRWQESSVNGTYKLKAVRGAKLILPGQAFIREGIGQFRATGVRWLDNSPETEIECMLDVYSLPDIDDDLGEVGGSPELLPAAPDLAFDFFELPPDQQSGPSIEVVVLRLRAHNQIFTADIHLSTNDSSFLLVGTQTHCQGGVLDDSVSDAVQDLIVEGPDFEPLNDDLSDALDLSSDIAAWQGGRQVGLMVNATGEKEVFFIQKFEPQPEADWTNTSGIAPGAFRRPTGLPNLRFVALNGGTTGATEPNWPTEVGETVLDNDIMWEAHRFSFKPINMIRARYGTSVLEFEPGDMFYVADSSDLEPFTLDGLAIGQTLYVKTTPRTSSNSVDIATVDSVSGVLMGDPADTTLYRVTDDGDVRTTPTGDRRISEP